MGGAGHHSLSRFPGYGSLCQCSGAWRWISSLWSAVECPVMIFAMGLCVRCDWAACKLTLRAMFLHFWSICVVCFALKLTGSWVAVGFGVGMGAFGWILIP